MAVKSRKSSVWQSIHFTARFIGLTGALTACIGLFIWKILGDELIGLSVATLGLAAIALGLLFELRGVANALSSRRGAFGLNVVLQIVVIFALAIGVNVFSFENYRRYDLTRDHIFTLDEAISKQLAQLRGDTEIIVLQQYVSFGQRAEYKQDKYDFAAQRKIVEKVKDLVEEFRDFSPRFRVTVLDVQEDNYQAKLDQILADISAGTGGDSKDLSEFAKELSKAIENAPENSIFFASMDDKKIQRLSFSDIYQLDKQASISEKNLVLKYQGVKPFANKIFNIDEKKPRVVAGIVHPVLGFQNQLSAEFTMSGAKKILETYGFDCTDLILRKVGPRGNLSDPIALSYDENRFEQIEDELAELSIVIPKYQERLTVANERYRFWADSSLAKLNEKYVYVVREDGRQGVIPRASLDELKKSGLRYKLIDVDEDDRKNESGDYKAYAERYQHTLDYQKKEQKSLEEEKAGLRIDDLAETRRFTDIEAKMKKRLRDADLLIIPRITLINAPREVAIPNQVHNLDTAQLSAIKWYLKQGRPVLFLLGPTNEAEDAPPPGPMESADQLEGMLGELGFKLPKQTILYDIESKEYNERKIGIAFSKRETEVPGLDFDDFAPTFAHGKFRDLLVPHPIRTSLKVMNHGTGNKDIHEVRVRHPRPVYHVRTVLPPESTASLVGGLALPGLVGPLQASTIWVGKAQKKPEENGVFLSTRRESWNEEKPFIVNNEAPIFTRTKDDDPRKGTIEEERAGPFPIGVAVDTDLPASWYDKDSDKPHKVRLAVIGSGGIFIGKTLPPMKEKMFLDVANWLMGRDDLLARDAESWQYPRVAVKPDSVEFNLWAWGARLGLPLVFIYLGTIVWMVRRMR